MADSSQLTILIVEDSRLARLELTTLLKDCPDVRLLGEAADVPAARQAIEKLQPDLLLLDIQMPGEDGFALLDQLEQPPLVIFTTAYDAMALRSYDYDAVDYLVKPLELARLQQALDKARTRRAQATLEVSPEPLGDDDKVLLQDGERCSFVALRHIQQIRSQGNYCQACFAGQQLMLHGSLAQLEQRLPPRLFFRANRQQLVNVHHIVEVEVLPNGSYQVTLASTDGKGRGDVVELSRRHGARFRQLFGL